MDGYLIGCPICGGELAARGSVRQWVDCQAHHRASTDPNAYEHARIRARLNDLYLHSHPDSGPDCEGHDWVVLEHTRAMNLLECSRCYAWIMGPPG